MKAYTFHMDFYNLALLGTIYVGFACSLMLLLVQKGNKAANRILGLILLITVVEMLRALDTDIRLELPQFSLALGPLFYFYVRSVAKPDHKFRTHDLLHFCPVLVNAIAAICNASSIRSLNTVYPFLVFISVCAYLYAAQKLIKDFSLALKFKGGDRYRLKLRWLQNLVKGFAFLWLLWIPFYIIACLYPNSQSTHLFQPLYLLLSASAIGMAGMVILKPEISAPADEPYFLKLPSPDVFKHRAGWLKQMMRKGAYYQDPDLSLTTLAGKLGLTTHELSAIINTILKQSFNDFVNEYRVADVVRKLQDPAFDQLTLEGIAYDSGFNSPSTFHRAFKRVTGETPAAYKKQLSSYNLTYGFRPALVISYQVTRNHMFKNHLKIAWRNTTRNKASSLINISGLAVGMAVAMLIGLWIWDEVSFNKFNTNYDRIVQVLANKHVGGSIATQASQPFPLSAELRGQYGSDFKAVSAAVIYEQNINYHNHAFSRTGCFAEPAMTDIMTLHMVKGSKTAFRLPGGRFGDMLHPIPWQN